MNTSEKHDDSRKAEILAKSRVAKRDEGFDHAEKQGNNIGVIIYAVVAAILLIFSIPNHPNIANTVAALSFTWVLGGTISYYHFTKQRAYLICAIASAIATVTFALMVFML
jgi:hypothetical protein